MASAIALGLSATEAAGSTTSEIFGPHEIQSGSASSVSMTPTHTACCAAAERIRSTTRTPAAAAAISADRNTNSSTRRSISFASSAAIANDLFQAVQFARTQHLGLDHSTDQFLHGALAQAVDDQIGRA